MITCICGEWHNGDSQHLQHLLPIKVRNKEESHAPPMSTKANGKDGGGGGCEAVLDTSSGKSVSTPSSHTRTISTVEMATMVPVLNIAIVGVTYEA